MTLSRQSLALVVLLLPLTFVLPARAQPEPSIDQVYQAANSGRLAQADKMIEQVLANHPKSAKAHFVKAELAARESNAAVARSELAEAEKIAPGLPFAKPEAVQALRAEVNRSRQAPLTPSSRQYERMPAAPAPSSQGQLPIATMAVIFALLAGAIYLFVRRRAPAPDLPTGSLSAGGLAQPTGTTVPGGVLPVVAQGYGVGYPGVSYPQQPQPAGIGSTLGQGLATGLAVGAGAVAAQEIGHRLFDHHGQTIPSSQTGALPEDERGLLDPTVNSDMGGQDFGINDAGGWDQGGGSDVMGGDWDT